MSQPLSSPERILQRLDWTVVRRLEGLLQGDYRTFYYGHGFEFASIREYQIGDDIRYIDWNVTARMNAPFVRQYYEDREIAAWFLLDLSPSVHFGTVSTSKNNLLVDFVGVLSRTLTRHGNRIGAIIFDGRDEKTIPVRSGRFQVLRLIDQIKNYHSINKGQMTDLALLFRRAVLTIPRRSLVFAISDFISLPGWEKYLQMLSQKHEVIPVRLVDPREKELPDIGFAMFEDAETGEQMLIDTHDKVFRRRFQESNEKRENELNASFQRIGVDMLTLATDDDLVQKILNFADLRKRRRSQILSVSQKRR